MGFINTQNSNLDDRAAVDDLLAIANAGPNGRRIVNCGGNTLSTPYKAGLTTLQSGTAIICMSSANYGTILYVTAGSARVFLRVKSNGAWSDWDGLISNADIPDSGWIPCTLKSGISTASNNYGGKAKLSYRKIGNQVYVVGGVGVTNYTGNTIISSIPSAYRPETTHYWLSPLTGSRIARCIISSGGDIVIEWIKNISDGSDYTGNVSWIDMSGAFFAK